MDDTFLIMGLPRSRTKWLSRFLTTDKSICFHDLSGYARNVGEMVHSIEDARSAAPIVGNSDSGQILVLDNLLPVLPRNPRIVYVLRDFEAALASFIRVTGIPGDVCRKLFELAKRKLDEAMLKYPGLVVLFEDMAQKSFVKEVWEHCLPGVPWSNARWQKYRNDNIQMTAADFARLLPSHTKCAATDCPELCALFS